MKGLLNLVGFILLWLVVAALTFGIGLLVLGPLYYYFVIINSDKRAEKAKQKLAAALMANEKLVGATIQYRLYALFSRRELIAITSSRMILIRRSIFGGFSMKDYQWKDLMDATLAENILPNLCGSRLGFIVNKGKMPISIDGIKSESASKIYTHAQAQEQEWEEKRRIRELEDKRAVSGGTIIHSGNSASDQPKSSPFADLERAKKMLDDGTVSDAEYQEIKSKILSRSTF